MKGIIIILALVVSCTSHAQWPTNPSINLPLSDTLSNGSQFTPQAVSDGNNGAIIIWSRATDIHGQRVNSEGVIQWQQNGIAVGTARDPVILSWLEKPVVVSDDSGGAIIAWAEYNQRRIIGASRIRSDGSRVWDTLVCFSTTGGRTNPAICKDGNGGAFIAWEDTRNGSNNTDIFVQHITHDGTMSWDANGVAVCTAVQNQTTPRVAYSGSGGVFVTWADNRILDSDIYVQLFNAQGERQFQANGMPVCATSGNPASDPRIVSTGNGEAIIAWTDGRSGGTWDIYAQKVNQDTTAWATNGVAVCNAVRSQWKCEMVADGLGGAIISWQDSRRISFNEWDVYAQKVGATGQGLWGVNGIPVCAQPGNPVVTLSLASDGDGGAIVAWQDNRNGNTDLYAQRVHRSGAIMWAFNGVPVSTAPSSQVTQTLCDDGRRGAIIAWADARHGSYLYIYGQGVDSTGALGGTTSVREEAAGKTFRLGQNYPNPFNPSTRIRFSVPSPRVGEAGNGKRGESEMVTLKVYDLMGREVRTLVNENLNAGSYETTFDATSLASGVYFYRLSCGGQSLSRKLTFIK